MGRFVKEILKADLNLTKRVDEYGKGLNDFEIRFVADCLDQLEKGRALTEPQRKLMTRLDDTRVR